MSQPMVTKMGATAALAACLWGSPVRGSELALSGPALDPVWDVKGHWDGVAVPKGSPLAYGTASGRLLAIDLKDGSVVTLAHKVDPLLRVGTGDRDTMLVAFGPWGHTVTAFTTKGERLWTYDTIDAIDDVWPVDLDGDGSSEVVVGFNARGGVLALGAGGRPLWSDQSLGNVWHVTAGPMDDRTLRVVTTSAGGQVHVFSTTGERVKDIQPRFYAHNIRLGDEPFVAGGDDGSVVATLDPSGWMVRLSDRKAGIGSLAAAPSVPWVGASTVSGDIYAFRATDGTVEGVAWEPGPSPQLAWAGTGDSALLLCASRGGLRAFRVTQPE